MGEKQKRPFQLSFNSSLKVDSQGSRITSDGSLILVRELDERLGLSELIGEHLTDRRGPNSRRPLADLFRQSVYSQQEGSAYNGHFESRCCHPLLLFNREGDCLAVTLRPGSVHSAEDWDELLLPEIERQQKQDKEVVFRVDAAVAKPEIYEALPLPAG